MRWPTHGSHWARTATVGRAQWLALRLMRGDLHEPGSGDAGQGRVAGAVRLDEELDAVAVLDREVRPRLDRVGDGPVRSRRRVGRDRGHDRRRAEEYECSLDQLSV